MAWADSYKRSPDIPGQQPEALRNDSVSPFTSLVLYTVLVANQTGCKPNQIQWLGSLLGLSGHHRLSETPSCDTARKANLTNYGNEGLKDVILAWSGSSPPLLPHFIFSSGTFLHSSTLVFLEASQVTLIPFSFQSQDLFTCYFYCMDWSSLTSCLAAAYLFW